MSSIDHGSTANSFGRVLSIELRASWQTKQTNHHASRLSVTPSFSGILSTTG